MRDQLQPGDILCPDGCSKDGALVLSSRTVDVREERARNMRYVDTTRSELTQHVIYHYKMCTSPSPHFVEADLLMANGSVRQQVMELEAMKELDRNGWILRGKV